MSTVTNPVKRPWYGTITAIDTGVFKGLSYVTDRSDTRRFVFKTTAEGKRNHPVFAITDSDFTVVKWVGPDAAKACAKYTA
jgi:hypothetical protein